MDVYLAEYIIITNYYYIISWDVSQSIEASSSDRTAARMTRRPVGADPVASHQY